MSQIGEVAGLIVVICLLVRMDLIFAGMYHLKKMLTG